MGICIYGALSAHAHHVNENCMITCYVMGAGVALSKGHRLQGTAMGTSASTTPAPASAAAAAAAAAGGSASGAAAAGGSAAASAAAAAAAAPSPGSHLCSCRL